MWIVGGCAIAAVIAVAVAIGRGWIATYPPPTQVDIAIPLLLVFLILGLLAWLDQRIWHPARPLAQGVIAFRALLAGAFGLTFCFAAAAFLVGEARFDETTVLPLPKGLTLVSRDESCGSQLCSVDYVVATSDGAPSNELTARVWSHLESKGWKRQRSNATCRDIGWLNPVHQCVFIDQDQSSDLVSLYLSTAFDLPPEPS